MFCLNSNFQYSSYAFHNSYFFDDMKPQSEVSQNRTDAIPVIRGKRTNFPNN